MLIKAIYATKEEVPESLVENYAERDGKWCLTGEGIKTQADIDALNTTNKAIRLERDTAQTDLKKFDGIDVGKVATMSQELEELKIAGAKGGKIDDEAINKIVESRLKMKIAPIERECDSLKIQLGEVTTDRDSLSSEKRVNTITSKLREAAADIVRSEAIPDVLARSAMFDLTEDGSVITKDGCGVAPGLTPQQYITEAVKTAKHWIAPSNGAGGSPKPGSAKIDNNGKQTFKEIIEDVYEPK